MDYPKALNAADWDKKKGVIAKAHATGIGDALKLLQKAHDAVGWAQHDPLLWTKAHPTADAFEKALDGLLQQAEAKIKPLKTQADKVETLASKWAVTFGKDKLVPKSATQAAKDVAEAAAALGKSLATWSAQLEKKANAVLAKLPQPAEDDEPADKLLSPDVLKANMVRCRNNEALVASFAYCPPGKDGAAAFTVHGKIPPKRLLAKLREASGGDKGTCGTLKVRDGEVLLTADKVLAGMAKRIRGVLLEAGLRFKAVRLLDESGTELEAENDYTETGGLLLIEQQLKQLTGSVTEALKRDPSLKAALLAAVSGVQNAIKRDDVAAAQTELDRLKALVAPPTQPTAGSNGKEPAPETKTSPNPTNVAHEAAYTVRKRQLAAPLKEALVRPGLATELRNQFTQAETLAKQGQFEAANQALAVLEERLEAIASEDKRFNAQAKTVLGVVDEFIKTVSPKNQERLNKLRAFALSKFQAGEFEAAHKALQELPKLASAIKKETTPSTTGSDDEGAGEFLRSMNDESDWRDQGKLVEELRTKLSDLKGWGEPDHDSLKGPFDQMEEAAKAGEHGKALELLSGVSPKILRRHAQYPARKDWLGRDAKRKEAKEAIDELETLGATEVAALRYDLAFALSLGKQEKYADAVATLDKVHQQASGLLDPYKNDPDFKRWASLNDKLLQVRGQLEQAAGSLPKVLTPAPSEIATYEAELEAIVLAEANGQYDDAADRLTTLAPLVQTLHDASTHLLRHHWALDAVAFKMGGADALDPIPPLDALVNAYRTARNKAAAAMTLAKAAQLDGLRATLLSKLDALTTAFENLTPTQRATQSLADGVAFKIMEDKRINPLLKIIWAKDFKAITGAMETLMKDFNDTYEEAITLGNAGQYPQAIAKGEEVLELGRQLQAARTQAGKAGQAFNKRWSPLVKRIDGLKQHIEGLITAPTKEQTAYLQALQQMTTLRSADPVDFAACLAHLKKKLEPALKVALAQKAEQTRLEIDQADDTDKAKTLIDGKADWELEALPPDQRAKLVETLRKGWGNPPSGDKRAAQRKVYAATRLDEDFLEYDKEQRGKIIESFKGDQELKTAQTGWGALPWPDRLKQLQRVANEQCKAYDFGPPPVVKLVDLGGDAGSVTNGYFDPNTKCIVINTNPYSSANDFGKAVDLIVHENSHYFQDQLTSGMIDAGSRDKRLVAQTKLFAMNSEPGGYVSSGEAPGAHAVYQQQPLEEHAHLIGPKTAQGILKAL